MTSCFKSSQTSRKRSFSKEEVNNMFEMATSALPNSSFAAHRQGRRKNIEIKKVMTSEIPPHVTQIFRHSEESPFLGNLDLNIPSLLDCCEIVLDSFKRENVLESMCCEQGTLDWKRKRKNRITGSTCYAIFTFKKDDWTKMLMNFFNPKSVCTKEMRHRSEQESHALEAFKVMNSIFELKTVGIVICQKYPLLAY